MTEYSETPREKTERMYQMMSYRLMVLIEKNQKIHGYKLREQLKLCYPKFVENFELAQGNRALIYHCLHTLKHARLIESQEAIKGKRQRIVHYTITERGKVWLQNVINQKVLDSLRRKNQ